VYGFGGQNVLYPAGERFSSIEHPVMRVEYPKNSINPLSGRVGGVGWFTHDDTPNQELYLQYDVMFEKGFQWVKGGKLPGIYGGRTECSGRFCKYPHMQVIGCTNHLISSISLIRWKYSFGLLFHPVSVYFLTDYVDSHVGIGDCKYFC
jgi:hypothetical protein